MSDLINGIFELGMAAAISRSVLRLWREKKLAGWSMSAVIWPTTWGFWNLYYYPHLHQFYSFVGGICVVSVNCLWLFLAWKYTKRS